MNEQERLSKNKQIAETMRETRLRHSQMDCKVISLKIQENKLSRNQKESLNRVFLEAKWFKNEILNHLSNEENLESFDLKKKIITHKDKDMNDVESEIRCLSSQMKLSLLGEIKTSLKSLKTRKSNGGKVGRIRYFKEVNSIDLPQKNISYKIIGNNKFKIQGMKTLFKINGIAQLEEYEYYELANAKLIRKPTGIYIALTIFVPKESKLKNGKTIGLDLGIRTSITTSEGKKYKVLVQESDRLKRLQKKLFRQIKGSKRYNNTIHLIRVEYQKLTNQKNDATNKIVAELLENSTIVMQDELLNQWKFRFGKTIQHSILGRVKSSLNRKSNVIVLSSSLPTTKFCKECGTINSIALKDTVFKCSCGNEEDRDVHAAKNMIWFYENSVGMGRTKFKREEINREIQRIFQASLSREAEKALASQ